MKTVFTILLMAFVLTATAQFQQTLAFKGASVPVPSAGGGSGIPTVGLLDDYYFNGDCSDSSGNGNPALPLFSPGYTTGQDSAANHAIALNGTSQSVLVTNVNFTTQDFSFTVWVKPNSLTNTPVLFGNNSFSAGGYLFYISPDGSGLFRCSHSGVNNVVNYGAGVIKTGVWQNVAVIRSGTTATIYTNGVYVISGTIASPASATIAFTIGSLNSSLYLNGSVDEVKIYTNALTSTDVMNIYLGGAK